MDYDKIIKKTFIILILFFVGKGIHDFAVSTGRDSFVIGAMCCAICWNFLTHFD